MHGHPKLKGKINMLNDNDLYFKDCFTKNDENIDLNVHKATIECLKAKNDKFSLDSEGNLVVQTITTASPAVGITLNDVYPIGSIYLSVSQTNPSSLFGGTWEAFANGRTLVGIDTQQEEFNTVNKLGGAKDHILTTQEMPSHNHKRPNSILYNGSSSWWIGGEGGTTIEVVETPTSSSGGNQAHNNLQPYIVVYMWKRVA